MLQRLGFPSIEGHRRFVAALAIDAIGSGVWMPFEMLFFLTVTDLPLVEIGVAFSIGGLVGIPASLMAGPAVDRLGPKPMLVGANVLLAATFALAPTVSGLAGVIAVAVASSVANSMFWAAFMPMVTAIAAPGEREKWFGFLGAMRNVGFALGGLGAAAVLALDTRAAYVGAAWLNAASFVVSAVLFLTVTTAYAAERGSDDEPPSGAIVDVLRDRGFLWFLPANLAFALSCLTLNVAFPIYLTKVLNLPGWVAGTAFVVNTVLVGLGQGLVVRRMTGIVRARALQVGWLFFAVGYAGLLASDVLPLGPAIVIALAAVAVYSLGEMTCGPVLSTLAAEAPPEHLRGRYSGFFQMTWNLGNICAPLLFTWLLARGPVTFWFGATVIVAIGALVTAVVGRRLPVAALPVTNAAH